jgi:ubiquinone/menaquinone biosynthesis C-methylase UbiE
VKEYFSLRSEYWESLYTEPNAEQNFIQYELARRKEIVFSLIAGIPTDRVHSVLDLACGAGHYLVDLADMGFDCIGVDLSEEMLDLTRRKLDSKSASNVTLIHSDCCSVPVDDHSMDLVTCIGLLEYLDSEADALREIKRLLSPGGVAIVTFPNLLKLRNLLNPYYYLVRIWTYFFKGVRLSSAAGKDYRENATCSYGKATVSRYTLRRAKKILHDAGFAVRAVHPCGFGPFSLWKKRRGPLLRAIKTSRFLEALCQHLPLRFLACFANRWVILIQPESDR